MKIAAVALIVLLPQAAPSPQAAGGGFGPRTGPFLERHCFECHSEEARKGNLRLDTLSTDLAKPEILASWIKIYDRVRAGEMPPAKQTRPPKKDADGFVDELRRKLEASSLARRSEGRVPVRRLNRDEYQNTLRDLLSVSGLEVKDLLPEDGRVAGFTKVGSALDLSHVQLAKYMEAADVALDAAIATLPERPKLVKERFFPGHMGPFQDVLHHGDAVFLKDGKFDPEPFPMVGLEFPKTRVALMPKEKLTGTVGVFRHEDEAFRGKFSKFTVRDPGFYRLRASHWSFLWDKGEVKPSPKTEAVVLMAGSRVIGLCDAPSLTPREQEIVVWLNAGESVGWNAASIRHLRVSERKGRAAEYTGPGVAVDWLDVEGPLLETWPPESHRRLFSDLPIVQPPKKSEVRAPYRRRGPVWTVESKDPVADADRLLRAFLKRAFRRPVEDLEVARYVAIACARLGARASFEEAMKSAYKGALCSPDFIFRRETKGPLDDWAVASRLSYFLWNSMPDDALFALAAEGKLRAPDVLRTQVERMLADPKAARLVEDFADQWLELRNIDATTPDRRLYPEFSPYLKECMVQETRTTLREMVAQDRSVAEVVHSDWSMINQRLAELYGIPGVTGTAFRKVTLPPESHRGGLITQASVLKVTANGTTTSPVKRGTWILDCILGRPPEPPPPDVPAVEPDVRGTTTIRDLLAKHRSQPACASCHARIDPPGFALESFDVIGGWRTRYRSLGKGDAVEEIGNGGRRVEYRLAQAVDPTSTMADGKAFKDVDEFKRILLQDPEAIARGLTGKLAMYATGGALDFADRAPLDHIVARSKAKGFGLRSLIHELVQSPLFLQK